MDPYAIYSFLSLSTDKPDVKQVFVKSQFLLQLVLVISFMSGCATKASNQSLTKKTEESNHHKLAIKLYQVSDLSSLAQAFNFGKVGPLMYQEEVIYKMYRHFYSSERFEKWMISFLERNFSEDDLRQLIQQFESPLFLNIKAAMKKNHYSDQAYQLYVQQFKQTENNVERAEVVARTIVVTKLVAMTHTILSAQTTAIRRANYFVKYDHIPTTKMLLQLKQLEGNVEQKLKENYGYVFEEMTMTLMYSFKDMNNTQLYDMHNFFNQKIIRNLNERVNLALTVYMRDTRQEFTKEMIVYMAEKHSDRVPAAITRY